MNPGNVYLAVHLRDAPVLAVKASEIGMVAVVWLWGAAFAFVGSSFERIPTEQATLYENRSNIRKDNAKRIGY